MAEVERIYPRWMFSAQESRLFKSDYEEHEAKGGPWFETPGEAKEYAKKQAEKKEEPKAEPRLAAAKEFADKKAAERKAHEGS